MKIILIVLAVLILIGILAAGSCVYFIYRAKQKVRQFEKQVQTTFPTPTPTAPSLPGAPATPPSVQVGPAVDMGALIYPGATPLEGGGQLSMGGGAFKTQQYTTSDSVDKVVAFYKDKLGPTATVAQSEGQTVVQLLGPNGITNVVIGPDTSPGKTKISISSMSK